MSMNTAIQVISAHLTSLQAGAKDIPSISDALSDGDSLTAAVGVASLGVAVVGLAPLSESVALGLVTAGVALGTVSLADNLTKIADSALHEGVIRQSDLNAARVARVGRNSLRIAPYETFYLRRITLH